MLLRGQPLPHPCHPLHDQHDVPVMVITAPSLPSSTTTPVTSPSFSPPLSLPSSLQGCGVRFHALCAWFKGMYMNIRVTDRTFLGEPGTGNYPAGILLLMLISLIARIYL